jgi:hypothetical protein
MESVRRFRINNRVEQCVSIWLTDGEDSSGLCVDDPRNIDYPTRCPLNETTIRSVVSGKSYSSEKYNHLVMPMILDIHRDITGASVVVIDLSSSASLVLSKVMTSEQIQEFAEEIASKDDSGNFEKLRTSTKIRRRGGRGTKTQTASRTVKITKQKKDLVLIKKTSKTFGTDGIVSITRKAVDSMGCDSYIITHPKFWNESSELNSKSIDAAISKLDQSNPDSDASVAACNVRKVLSAQTSHIAMRRFAEILVPFLADGGR